MDELKIIKKMEKPYNDLGLKIGANNQPHPVYGGDSLSVQLENDSICWRYHGGKGDGKRSGTIVDLYMVVHDTDARGAIKMLVDEYGTGDVDVKKVEKKFKEKKSENIVKLSGSASNPSVCLRHIHPIEYCMRYGKRRSSFDGNPENAFANATSIHYTAGRYGDDDIFFAVGRWDKAKGEKDIRTFSKINDGEWEIGLPKTETKIRRPLYKQDEIFKASPDVEIWIVEGEKCMDALQAACDNAKRKYPDNFPDVIVTTSIGGSNAFNKTDWSPICSHDKIKIIRDNDDAGLKYAQKIAAVAFGTIVNVGEGRPEGYDVYDWLQENDENAVRKIARGDFDEKHAQEESKINRDMIGVHFNTGSEIEIARFMMHRRPVVYDGYDIWEYDDIEKIYTKVNIGGDLFNEVSSLEFSGTTYGGNEKPLVLGYTKVENVIKTIKKISTKEDFFMKETRGIFFKNKVVTVNKGQMDTAEYSRDLPVKEKLTIDYDPSAKAPRFLQYLDEVFRDDDDKEEKKALMQEFTGACLMGDAGKHSKALILLGEGANGKSVFLDIISSLFPSDQISYLAPQQIGDGADNNSLFGRAQLIGKRINIANEMPEKDILESSGLKSVITGEEINARFSGGNMINFKPQLGMVIAANALPFVNDQSDGFWRRWVIIKFNRQFKVEERDIHLAETITKNEKAGVYNWALEGARRLSEREVIHESYTIPESSTKEMMAWNEESDQVLMFLRDECETGVLEQWTKASDVYLAYTDWAKKSGQGRMNKTKFGKRLARKVLRDDSRNDARYYQLTLKK